jgi:hypothetical protein
VGVSSTGVDKLTALSTARISPSSIRRTSCQTDGMSSTNCAFCQVKTHLTFKWGEGIRVGGSRTIQGVAVCDNCRRASVAFRSVSSVEQGSVIEKLEDHSRVLTWYPQRGVAPEFPDVPESITTAAREAHTANSIGASMAAILMARTVVEASAKAKTVTSGNLLSKIDALKALDLIRASTAEAAHEIRHMGNNMAHGDIDDKPTTDEADDVLDLMDEVLRDLFQGPALTARIRAKREVSA